MFDMDRRLEAADSSADSNANSAKVGVWAWGFNLFEKVNFILKNSPEYQDGYSVATFTYTNFQYHI